ncbi:MAG: tagatose-6-phosphate kinase [Flavobacteriales bacterium TMED235]|nr:MAG: tagatose-6-phosphate kinase [Flavobacteriales bacterium TMED235]|tara:strand:+ start:201 stop:1373 length:1173 start_codon:yes stop_codon:yes gene_type:complete
MNRTAKFLDHYILKRRNTMLGVGPMSKNCVDATIEISNQYKVPIFLIASRRQIECESLGGGYCNNWNTEQLSKYVSSKDKKNMIILSRDHGGSFQGNPDIEKKNNYKKTLLQAKESFKIDIDSNFKIIHIDTSYGLNKEIPKKKSMNMLFELYSFVCNYSKKQKKKILIEIGTEEQTGNTNSFKELDNFLNIIFKFCLKNKFQKPTFVVIQSGTKVMETRNVGIFESPVRIKGEIPVEIQLFKVLEICKKYHIFMKEHNADYLTNDSLKWHPKIGVHAANVAPEFGVAETKAFVEILKKNNQKKILDEFLQLSYNSYKWKKWILNLSLHNNDYEKSIIAGHYVFSSKSFLDMKKKLSKNLSVSVQEIDISLKNSIKKSILRYIYNFGLVS